MSKYSVVNMRKFFSIIFAGLLFPLLVAVPALAQIDTDFSTGGGIKIGTSTTTCDAAAEGGIRYNSTDNNIEVCDGSAWGALVASSCDNAPAFLSFTEQNDLAASTLAESNIVAITGMDAGCSTNVGISGTGGSPQYRTCSNSDCSSVLQAWTAANNTLDIQGNYVQLRATSSASQATAFTITLNTGPTSSDWVISTGVTGCSPEGTVCADGTVYAGLSGASTPMYVTRCDAGQTWGGSSCDGTRSTMPWNNGNTTGRTTVGTTGYVDGQSYTATEVATDSDSIVAGTQQHQPAQYCTDLVIHGKSDWYLPARNELNTIYGNKTAIGNFDETGTFYWSSSEGSNTAAWRQRFSDGDQYAHHKYYTYAVRCARR